MIDALRARLLPEHQRRTLVDLTEDLDLNAGDSFAKRSAFWIMLVLSSVIASAGVLSDSTATVIGAMIIAPLSTPIMGIALGIAKRRRTGAGRYVLLGSATVVLVGILFALVLPHYYDLHANSQITGRTSPGAFDLIAALATGLAGAIALARKDVAAVLPGVAIAISLVPPLAVVGVCIGQGAFLLALGALLLFVSNLLALVLAGSLVFAALGYAADLGPQTPAGPRRKAYVTLGLLMTIVIIPLAINTLFAIAVTVLSGRIQEEAEAWLAPVPGASVEDVEFHGAEVDVEVRTPGDLPPTADLVEALGDNLPEGFALYVVTSLGERIEATGSPGAGG